MLFSKENLHITIDHTGYYVQAVHPEAGRKKPVLVFLHHALGSVDQWKGFPEDLAAISGLQAIAYDRQGHGRSDAMTVPREKNYLHVEAFERLPGILEALDIRQPLLVGHSDGATIALLYATRFPCAGVIAEAPHILVESHTLNGIWEALKEREKLIAGLEKYHGDKATRLVEAWADTWLAPWFRDWTISDELQYIQCPVLVIQGTSDMYGTNVHLEGILRARPGKTCPFLVKGGGHFLHIEARESVIGRMAEFIRDTISTTQFPKYDT